MHEHTRSEAVPHVAPSPVQLLDAVLPAFAGDWVRAARGEAEPPVVYVDAFAGAEWRFGTGDPGRSGGARAVSAVLAAADAGAVGVLVEEDPALLARLRADLVQRGQGGRVREGTDAGAAAPGELLLVEADFGAVVDVLAAVPEGGRLLAWAAPPGARRLPGSLLSGLLADPGAELLLRFPVADLLKQGEQSGPLADLPPFARRLVDGCSALLGDERHGWIAAWRATQRTYGEEAALTEALEGFAGRLRRDAGERLVKPVHVAGGRGGERLFLVTRSPEAALALNAAVLAAGAGDAGAAPLPEDGPSEPAPALDLFPAGQPCALRGRMDPAPVLAEHWAARHRGETVPLRELLAGVAASGATLEDVRRALGRLRRSGHAVYRSLRGADAVVGFPEAPAAPVRPRRAARAHAGGDLFDPPTSSGGAASAPPPLPSGSPGAQYGS